MHFPMFPMSVRAFILLLFASYFITVDIYAQAAKKPAAHHPNGKISIKRASKNADSFPSKRDFSICPRYAVGDLFHEPDHYYSLNGILDITLGYYTTLNSDGNTEYCYMTEDGVRSPVLHVKPGDHLRLTLVNLVPADTGSGSMPGMSMTATNVHFHGLAVSPAPGQDDVLNTSIDSGSSFTYDLDIPVSQVPGLYWYHPHIHGLSENAVLGGASGVIIVDGIENIQAAVAGLPVRTLTFRDNLVPGNPTPGGEIPSWDLSLNFIPIPYSSNYTTVTIPMVPGADEFWRVLNAGADTIMQLEIEYDGVPQNLQIIALDGVPVTTPGGILNQTTILLPPSSRAEFIITGPDASVASATLSTLNIDTGADGDNDPTRPLATLLASVNATAPMVMPTATGNVPLNPWSLSAFLNLTPTQNRSLYFSETISDPSDPNSATNFYITVEGETPVLFTGAEGPAIVTTQGTVEDWVIENQAQEDHVFHIHQVHFLVLEKNGVAVDPQTMQFMDTIVLPAWDGVSAYPSVKIRMDFTNVDVGEFVYHCHILGHEDGGMMAKILVQASTSPTPTPVVTVAPTGSHSAASSYKPALLSTIFTGGIVLFWNYSSKFR
jgi:FtsP/CotA-like multicopper oxidase with cupredoxin domain